MIKRLTAVSFNWAYRGRDDKAPLNGLRIAW